MQHIKPRMLKRCDISLFLHFKEKIILKVGTFTVFDKRPDKLVYHEKCFHVLDIKVK